MASITYPMYGDTRYVNGETLYYNGYSWVSMYQPITYSGSISGTFTTINTGDNMSNQVNNLYDNLFFTRDWGYEPWIVTNIKSGKVVAKVHEVRRGGNNGLKSDSSLYSVLGDKGEITYPLYAWNALLEKLGS